MFKDDGRDYKTLIEEARLENMYDKRVFVDTDIILDVALARNHF